MSVPEWNWHVGVRLRENQDEVVRLYVEEMMCCRAIGAKFGVCGGTVQNFLKSRGISLKDARIVDWPIAEMIRRYEAGETVEDLGRWLGRSGKVVNKVLLKNGCKMRRRGPKDGPGHKGWKGGRTIDKSGYVLVWNPDHPQANHAGYVREHRLVAEEILGRFLTRDEVVHHKDGDRSNNDPENLQVFDSNADHLRHELTGRVPEWTELGRERLGLPPRQPSSNHSWSESGDPASNGTTDHSTE